MKQMNVIPVILGIVIISVIASCESTKKANEGVKLTNATDSVSYALGINIGESLQQQGLDSLNTDLVSKAMEQAFANDTTVLMDNTKALAYLNSYFQRMQQEQVTKNLEKGKAYLAENGKKPGVITTPSGLQYEVVQEGTGVMPKDGDTVVVHYTGKLAADGLVFDSSVEKGTPVTYPLNGFMKGFTEGLKLMKVGSKYKLTIPSDLGYGQMGGGSIPPNSVLLFDLELLNVIPGKIK
ncbi:MAG: FKBP-type peptidyl-prolyl cis-trans isomerase [Chitinophagales bacterium]|nr:FKBP-type peptidyl-prolyl cis-trans isomerase [Chitinophagales bacterium]